MKYLILLNCIFLSYASAFKGILNGIKPFNVIYNTKNKIYFRNKVKNNLEKRNYFTLFDTFQDVKEITAKELSINKDKIKLESNFTKDLGADSLDSVQIIMALEEKFNITISDSDAVKIKTVQDAVDYINKHKDMKN